MVSPIERGGPTELTAAFDLARFARSAMVLPRLRGGRLRIAKTYHLAPFPRVFLDVTVRAK